jgi:UDP:flavonoid glycosyltransferase YjiC (YdhE family)
MKISIIINGTRGDVQPMLALAIGLKKNGYEVILCAPPENEELVNKYNCPFVAFGPNYKELFKQNAQMKGGATAAPSQKEMKKETENQIKKLPKIIEGSNLVLGVGFVLGVHTVADLLKIPYRFVIFYPMLLGTSKKDPLFNRLLFGLGRSMTNLVMKSFINNSRNKLGLPPINDVWKHWMGEHVIAACDKELNAVRDGVSFNFTQTGYMLLPSQNGLPESVDNFLKSGKPPIYIGFGSNPVDRPEKYNHIFNEVSKETNQRFIISKGWANLPEINSTDILYVDEMPFELLFPQLAAIVYHGGTGTMAAAARAAIPQAVFPFMADQFENRKQIVKLGLGPNTCDFKKLSAEALSSAIKDCVNNNEFKKNAFEISEKLKMTNGLDMTIGLIEREFKKNNA